MSSLVYVFTYLFVFSPSFTDLGLDLGLLRTPASSHGNQIPPIQ